jgi:hypothetical protein
MQYGAPNGAIEAVLQSIARGGGGSKTEAPREQQHQPEESGVNTDGGWDTNALLAALQATNEHGNTPLHLGLENNAPAPSLAAVLAGWPAAAQLQNNGGTAFGSLYLFRIDIVMHDCSPAMCVIR